MKTTKRIILALILIQCICVGGSSTQLVLTILIFCRKLQFKIWNSGKDSFCVGDLSTHKTHKWRSILTDQGALGTFGIAPSLQKKKKQFWSSCPFNFFFSWLAPLSLACLPQNIAGWEEGFCQSRQACASFGAIFYLLFQTVLNYDS